MDISGEYMKRDLPYFQIEEAFGGNQDWFTNIVMNIGGCAAATACDCCIYLALRKGIEILYPYNVHHLTKKDYVEFSQKMKPYIKPRVGGVRRLEWFVEGFQKYIDDINKKTGKNTMLEMEIFSGEHTYLEAKEMIEEQMEMGYPVPCLLLKHKHTDKFKDYIWHWFLLVGYEKKEQDLIVRTATYGESDAFSLRELWDTGYGEKGGLIRIAAFTN